MDARRLLKLNRRAKVVAIVCIAIFAFTAIAAVPMFALFDAQTPIDALFSVPTPPAALPVEDVALPAAPVVDVQSPRAPPLA
jgi:hypothetical protein